MSKIFHIHGRGDGGHMGGDARADNIIRAQFGAQGGGKLARALTRAWASLRAWHNRRVAVRELSAMPDALLRDIGIERYQIRAAVRGAYPGIIRLRAEPGMTVAVNEVAEVDAVAEVKQAA